MSKLQEPVVPGKTDPLVRWEIQQSPSVGGFRPIPPPTPDGYEDGYWSLDAVVSISGDPQSLSRTDRRSCIALKWKFRPGPNDRDRMQSLERAAMDLFNAVQFVFRLGEKHLTSRGYWIEPPDTSGDRWIWESFHKWARALRGDGKPIR